MEAEPVSQSKTSSSAIASLVCGILGCIPFVTGLAAVILGIVGIRKTGNPTVKGRGLAIAGLILGLLSLAGWTVTTITAGAGIYAIAKLGIPANEAGEKFTKAVSEGKIDEALGLTIEGTDKASIEALAEKLKPLGAFQSLTTTTVEIKDMNGLNTITIGGTANFATASRTYSFTVKQIGEAHKIEKFSFE